MRIRQQEKLDELKPQESYCPEAAPLQSIDQGPHSLSASFLVAIHHPLGRIRQGTNARVHEVACQEFVQLHVLAFHLVLEEGQALAVHGLEIISGCFGGIISIWKHSMGKGYCCQGCMRRFLGEHW